MTAAAGARPRREVVVIGAVLGLAFGAVVARALVERWWPTSDHAIILSEIHDVGAHTPLIGVYSRYGWRHPGPWLFWLLAPFYRLGGASPNAALVSAAMVNFGSLAWLGRLALRRGGRSLFLVVMVAAALLVRSMGPQMLSDPWNPFLPLLPFLLLLFVAWDLAAGHRWSLPVAVALASFASQSHVAYLVPAVAVLGWGCFAHLVWSREVERTSWVRVGGLTVAVVVALWAPVVAEQVRHEPGNLTLLADFFQRGATPDITGLTATDPIGPVRGAELLAREVVGAPWVGLPEPTAIFSVAGLSSWLLLLPAVCLGGLLAVAGRRRSREEALVLGTSMVALAAAELSLARAVGDTPDWIVRFTWAVALFVTTTTIWAGWRLLGGRLPDQARGLLARVVPVIGAVVVVGAVAQLVVRVPSSDLPGGHHGRGVEALADAVVPWLGDHQRRTVTITSVGSGAGFVDAALVYELERQGVEVKVMGIYDGAWPEFRRTRQPVGTTLTVVAGEDAATALADQPATERIAAFTDVSSDDRAKGALPVAVYASPPA